MLAEARLRRRQVGADERAERESRPRARRRARRSLVAHVVFPQCLALLTLSTYLTSRPGAAASSWALVGTVAGLLGFTLQVVAWLSYSEPSLNRVMHVAGLTHRWQKACCWCGIALGLCAVGGVGIATLVR